MYLCHVVLKTIIFPTIPRNLSKIELPGKELELFKISIHHGGGGGIHVSEKVCV